MSQLALSIIMRGVKMSTKDPISANRSCII
jgi:hypothetical protein